MKTACDCDNNDSDNQCRICNFLNFLKGLLKESTGFLFQGRVHSGGASNSDCSRRETERFTHLHILVILQ